MDSPRCTPPILKKMAYAPRRMVHEVRRAPVMLRELKAWRTTASEDLPKALCEDAFRSLGAFVGANKDVTYSLDLPIRVGRVGGENYVGAQALEDGAIFVPNAMDAFAHVCRDRAVDYIWFDKTGNEGPFRWTGGVLWRDKFVCFPRTSNDLLLLDLASNEPVLVDLGQGYKCEHHYGGVLCGDRVYQPPRDEDHLLCIDLGEMSARRIPIAPKVDRYKTRYCGSALHPNGLAYFLPERGRVIEFDPSTERLRFIGKPVDATVFGVALAPDGCLYGFSSCSKGILRVDPRVGSVRMLRTDIGCPGAYGTRLGINGKLYSVPGDGDFIYEFDPSSGEVRKVCSLGKAGAKAKCAGSAMLEDGTIAFAPAFEPDAYLLGPSRPVKIPEELTGLFGDCY